MDHRTNSAKILCCSVVVGVPQPTAGEGDELERNPAYQTSASLIPSSSNPSYAGLNVMAKDVFRTLFFVRMRALFRL